MPGTTWTLFGQRRECETAFRAVSRTDSLLVGCSLGSWWGRTSRLLVWIIIQGYLQDIIVTLDVVIILGVEPDVEDVVFLCRHVFHRE